MKSTALIDYEYARQPNMPEWFDGRYEYELYATSGSHPLNEWAGFHSREDAVSWLAGRQDKQAFVDNYEIMWDEIYERDSVMAILEKLGYDSDDHDWHAFTEAHKSEILAGAVLADLSDVFRATSVF